MQEHTSNKFNQGAGGVLQNVQCFFNQQDHFPTYILLLENESALRPTRICCGDSLIAGMKEALKEDCSRSGN